MLQASGTSTKRKSGSTAARLQRSILDFVTPAGGSCGPRKARRLSGSHLPSPGTTHNTVPLASPPAAASVADGPTRILPTLGNAHDAAYRTSSPPGASTADGHPASLPSAMPASAAVLQDSTPAAAPSGSSPAAEHCNDGPLAGLSPSGAAARSAAEDAASLLAMLPVHDAAPSELFPAAACGPERPSAHLPPLQVPVDAAPLVPSPDVAKVTDDHSASLPSPHSLGTRLLEANLADGPSASQVSSGVAARPAAVDVLLICPTAMPAGHTQAGQCPPEGSQQLPAQAAPGLPDPDLDAAVPMDMDSGTRAWDGNGARPLQDPMQGQLPAAGTAVGVRALQSAAVGLSASAEPAFVHDDKENQAPPPRLFSTRSPLAPPRGTPSRLTSPARRSATKRKLTALSPAPSCPEAGSSAPQPAASLCMRQQQASSMELVSVPMDDAPGQTFSKVDLGKPATESRSEPQGSVAGETAGMAHAAHGKQTLADTAPHSRPVQGAEENALPCNADQDENALPSTCGHGLEGNLPPGISDRGGIALAPSSAQGQDENAPPSFTARGMDGNVPSGICDQGAQESALALSVAQGQDENAPPRFPAHEAGEGGSNSSPPKSSEDGPSPRIAATSGLQQGLQSEAPAPASAQEEVEMEMVVQLPQGSAPAASHAELHLQLHAGISAAVGSAGPGSQRQSILAADRATAPAVRQTALGRPPRPPTQQAKVSGTVAPGPILGASDGGVLAEKQPLRQVDRSNPHREPLQELDCALFRSRNGMGADDDSSPMKSPGGKTELPLLGQSPRRLGSPGAGTRSPSGMSPSRGQRPHAGLLHSPLRSPLRKQAVGDPAGRRAPLSSPHGQLGHATGGDSAAKHPKQLSSPTKDQGEFVIRSPLRNRDGSRFARPSMAPMLAASATDASAGIPAEHAMDIT